MADRGLPAACPDRVAFSDEMTGAGQDQRPGQFYRWRRSVARVGDQNAPLVRGDHIDGDVARAGRSNEPQPRQTLDVAAQGRALAHDANGVERQEPFD